MRAKKGDYCLVHHTLSGVRTHGWGASVWRTYYADIVKKTTRDGIVTATERRGKLDPDDSVVIIAAKDVNQAVREAVKNALSFDSLPTARAVFTSYEGLVYGAKYAATITDEDVREVNNPSVPAPGYRDNPRHRGGLTLAKAKAEVRPLGFTLKSKPETGEYVVTPSMEKEGDRSYYTDDLHDAVATARSMAARRWEETRARGMGGGYIP